MYTKVQIEMKRKMLERELSQLPSINCNNCEHWSDGWCKSFEANPPPEVVSVGCDGFLWDGIPF